MTHRALMVLVCFPEKVILVSFNHCSVMTFIQFVMTCLETFKVKRFTTAADKQGAKKASHFWTISHSFPIVHILMYYLLKFNQDVPSHPQMNYCYFNLECTVNSKPYQPAKMSLVCFVSWFGAAKAERRKVAFLRFLEFWLPLSGQRVFWWGGAPAVDAVRCLFELTC